MKNIVPFIYVNILSSFPYQSICQTIKNTLVTSSQPSLNATSTIPEVKLNQITGYSHLEQKQGYNVQADHTLYRTPKVNDDSNIGFNKLEEFKLDDKKLTIQRYKRAAKRSRFYGRSRSRRAFRRRYGNRRRYSSSRRARNRRRRYGRRGRRYGRKRYRNNRRNRNKASRSRNYYRSKRRKSSRNRKYGRSRIRSGVRSSGRSNSFRVGGNGRRRSPIQRALLYSYIFNPILRNPPRTRSRNETRRDFERRRNNRFPLNNIFHPYILHRAFQ